MATATHATPMEPIERTDSVLVELVPEMAEPRPTIEWCDHCGGRLHSDGLCPSGDCPGDAIDWMGRIVELEEMKNKKTVVGY